MDPVLLTTQQLATRLGLAQITLQIWRKQGVGLPFVKQGTRVFYRLTDVQDYERRNVDSLSAWLLGSDRPLPEMEVLVRAANLPLQKIRQRIAKQPEIDGEAVSPLPQQHPQPADSDESPEPVPKAPSADSDWQPQARPEHSSHQSPSDAGLPLACRLSGNFAASLSTPRPFAPKAPELITTQQAADRLGLTTNALHELRCRDDGLPIVQKGFVVGYRLEDIQAFEQREALAMLGKVLSTGQPLPMIWAMTKAMLSPPVTDSSTPLSLPIALPAPEKTIAAPSNIHRMTAVDAETIPTVQLLKDCSVIKSTQLATLQPTREQDTPPRPEPATPQPLPNRLIAPAFSAQTSAPSTLAWYLIHTKPRQEALALTNLSRQGFECYMPMLRLQKIRQRKTALVAEPMFPRYLFIRLDTSGSGQSWSPIRSTLGVNQLVRFGGQPAKVDGQLIDLIRSRVQGTHAQPLFSEGDNVTVADGPFAGLEAIYQNTDAESRSMILLNILSKPVAMRIDTASLRKVG